jgi:hypothetical protein
VLCKVLLRRQVLQDREVVKVVLWLRSRHMLSSILCLCVRLWIKLRD